MTPTEHMVISIPRVEVDEEMENRIDMEQGDVLDENYRRDFIMDHFARADLMLKSVICTAKIMSIDGVIYGKEELEKASHLAIWINNLAKTLGCL